MTQFLENGIPTPIDCAALIASEEFKAIETFSNEFLRRNSSVFRRYGTRWVADPLHQWSRQWEYPYVIHAIDKVVRSLRPSESRFRILDAASGLTFLPWLLCARYSQAEVQCLDSDPWLAPLFQDLSPADKSARVAFDVGDLSKLPYPDATFDAIYCISALEHTRNYDVIVDELDRVLKPNGLIAITFDISLDGRTDIAWDEAVNLTRLLGERFEADFAVDTVASQFAILRTTNNEPPVLRTRDFAIDSYHLLPWRKPAPWKKLIRRMLQGPRAQRWWYDLTVCCLTFRRKSPAQA